ncbi:unnamed protein product [Xylocopa violacea]|uniref:Uncharacterized protein n=1 Tax=Xylocopa violacea TaxID=135666 RepID=A0ABP1NXV3_XYLVO
MTTNAVRNYKTGENLKKILKSENAKNEPCIESEAQYCQKSSFQTSTSKDAATESYVHTDNVYITAEIYSMTDLPACLQPDNCKQTPAKPGTIVPEYYEGKCVILFAFRCKGVDTSEPFEASAPIKHISPSVEVQGNLQQSRSSATRKTECENVHAFRMTATFPGVAPKIIKIRTSGARCKETCPNLIVTEASQTEDATTVCRNSEGHGDGTKINTSISISTEVVDEASYPSWMQEREEESEKREATVEKSKRSEAAAEKSKRSEATAEKSKRSEAAAEKSRKIETTVEKSRRGEGAAEKSRKIETTVEKSKRSKATREEWKADKSVGEKSGIDGGKSVSTDIEETDAGPSSKEATTNTSNVVSVDTVANKRPSKRTASIYEMGTMITSHSTTLLDRPKRRGNCRVICAESCQSFYSNVRMGGNFRHCTNVVHPVPSRCMVPCDREPVSICSTTNRLNSCESLDYCGNRCFDRRTSCHGTESNEFCPATDCWASRNKRSLGSFREPFTRHQVGRINNAHGCSMAGGPLEAAQHRSNRNNACNQYYLNFNRAYNTAGRYCLCHNGYSVRNANPYYCPVRSQTPYGTPRSYCYSFNAWY